MKRILNLPPQLVGIGFLVVITALTLITFTGAFRIPFKPDSRTVIADFERGGQLYKGDDVRLEGDISGSVKKVEAAPGDLTRVTMEVETAAGEIHSDARARVRNKTLLGGSFYVEIDRGSDGMGELAETAVIPRSRTSVQVEVDDVLDIFREPAMQGFKTMPGEFADALADAPPVADDIALANEIAPSGTVALDAVRGVTKGEDLPRLLQATAKTVSVLDSGNDDLRTLVSGAAATLQTTGRREAEIRETIDAAPSVTYDLTTTLARLDTTLDIADGLITRLRPAAPLVAPALERLQPALTNTRVLLDTARPLLRQALPLLTNLGAAAESVTPTINKLKPALRKVDEIILPYFARKDPDTGKSTTVMIGGTAAGFGGASAQQDENGHFIRFPASIGLSSPTVYVPCQSSLIDPTKASLLACDDFNTAVDEYLNYLPELDGDLNPSARTKK